jgi:hypothetical protein
VLRFSPARRYAFCPPFTRFQYPLVPVRLRQAKPIENMETRLAGTRRGDTVVVPAYGRTRIREAEGNKWSTWVCDLDGGYVHLTLPNKLVRSQVEKRVRDFPGTLPIAIMARLTATTPYLQAIATKVGPQPIDDDAIEESILKSRE